MMPRAEESIDDLFGRPFPWGRLPSDPPTAYARLREEQPICRAVTKAGQPVWLVTRYDDVRSVLSDPRVSSDTRLPGFPKLTSMPTKESERNFVRMDPPEHTVIRRVLAKSFLVKEMEALRPAIGQLVDDRVDAMISRPEGVADLVADVALPVPSTVLSWILGVRADDIEFFNDAALDIVRVMAAVAPSDELLSRATRANEALRAYLGDLAREQAATGAKDGTIMGRLVTAEAQGLITFDDVVNSAFVMLIAGHDTTAGMAAMGAFTLLEHPAQAAQLRADLTLLPLAVEELLRYLTTVHLVVLRVATEDIEVGGVIIPAGEGIVPLNLSANRDDAHFPAADEFDIHRGARDHFAFGYGIHQCIGQTLARIELHEIFRSLLTRAPSLRLAVPVAELEFRVDASMSSIDSLPVTW